MVDPQEGSKEGALRILLLLITPEQGWAGILPGWRAPDVRDTKQT